MPPLRLMFILFVGLSLCSSLGAQPFKCDGRIVLGTNRQGSTEIYTISFGSFFVISYSPIAFYPGIGCNALGFNPKDNYIYAVRENTNTIVRLRADGSFETVGQVPMVNQLDVYAGDCTPDGRYLCYDNALDQLLVFSVVNGFALENRINLFWDPSSVNSGPFTTRIDDFVIDPNNPTVAYTHHGKTSFDPNLQPSTTAGYLLKINLDFNDPNVGMVTPIARVTPSLNIARLGSLFFTAYGGLYGYGTENPGINPSESRLFAIDPQTAEANAAGAGGPSSPATDGCSCPYNLTVDYSVSPLVVTCTDSEVTYRLTITNRSFESISAVTLTDTVPEGMVIEAIDGDFTGSIDPATGVGTRFLTLNGLQVPPRGTVQMRITARVFDVPVGNTSSQVYLRNLPSLFDGTRVSDDLSTSNSNDPATFFADARFLNDVVLDITPPTDCLNDNDGQVTVTCPQFQPGVAYRIELLNQGWNPFTRAVIVDNDNSFFLDSMPSGRYRLDQVIPENLMCSYEWKDTTIIITPPNEQLQVSVQSNSPICEGMALQLNATLSPGGSVNWLGPRYTTNQPNPTWVAIDTTFSGSYKLTANYGACEQIRILDVRVKRAIHASIASVPNAYCEREPMELLATGVGDSLLLQWTGPNIQPDTSSLLEITSLTPADGGTYQVMMDNGACRDSAAVTISILPSPTIELPREMEVDFCDPVVLLPKITGDAAVTYTWTPTNGLSCDDCLNPEVHLPALYQLHVINDTLCTDSATVRVHYRGDDLLYVPNAFSPNFDGVNDYFQLFPSCVVTTIKKMEVYDRWGGTVFSAGVINPANIREFWDGQVNGKPASTGVYIWQTEIELINGISRMLRGEVSLLR